VTVPRLTEPLLKETDPEGTGAPATTGMLKVIGSALPTVVGLLVTATASPALPTWFTTTVVEAEVEE
jgi:hypothetical protein